MSDSAARPRSSALKAGAAVLATFVCIAVFGLTTTLVLATVAAGGFLLLRSRKSTRPASPTAPTLSAGAAPATPTADAATVVEMVRRDCLERGFFVDHQVKVQRATRGTPATATLTATSRTNKAFVVEVKATDSPYGTHVEPGWRDRGMGTAASAASRSMGSGVRSGLSAGREAALKKQVPAMEMEFAAFRREVLDRYLT